MFGASPVFLGFEVANDVAHEADKAGTMAFYQSAYNAVRQHNRDALVIMFHTFRPDTYPFLSAHDVALDNRITFGLDFRENLQRAKKSLLSNQNWPVVLGEWSLTMNGQPPPRWMQDQRKGYYEEFARMQLQAWETHAVGWCYWSYKTGQPNSTWNFRDMCEQGLLPGCSDRFEYAPPEWWLIPDCRYAYLDGKCEDGGVGLPDGTEEFLPAAIVTFLVTFQLIAAGVVLVSGRSRGLDDKCGKRWGQGGQQRDFGSSSKYSVLRPPVLEGFETEGPVQEGEKELAGTPVAERDADDETEEAVTPAKWMPIPISQPLEVGEQRTQFQPIMEVST
jgi:hypothetical protein